jgi:hypothetical protein
MRKLILILALLSSPAMADELQSRIESAISAFGGLIPHAPDVGLSWARIVIDNAVKQANPNAAVKSSAIGTWIVSNQPADLDPILMHRAKWLADTFKQAMRANTVYPDALPVQSISVAELKLRVDTALEKVTPGPTKEELDKQATEAGKAEERDRRVRAIVAEHAGTWE